MMNFNQTLYVLLTKLKIFYRKIYGKYSRIFWYFLSIIYCLKMDTKYINLSCIHQKLYYKTCFWQALEKDFNAHLFCLFWSTLDH